MNTIFEKSGGTYTWKNGYLYPNIVLPEEDREQIGKYGRMRKRYLKDQHPGLYTNLLLSGVLDQHLAEIDKACEDLKAAYPDVNWKEGKLLNGITKKDLEDWVKAIE